MSFQRPSYATNGSTNGHSNSYTAANAQRLARFDFDTTPETSADERSRSRGGPAGYQNGRGGGGRQQQQEQHRLGPLHLERQQATNRPRSRDYGAGGGGYGTDNASSRSRSRNPPPTSRSGYNNNDQVDQILHYISQHWSFMTTSTCCPIKTALQLMDPSSLGLADQYTQFQDVHTQLQNALKVIVNEHHQGFNSSIGTFHKIQTAIHSSQHRVRTLRAGLVQAKSSLSTARPELRAYATSSQSYEGMLAVLSQIEELRQLPDLLDTQISEKRFLAAVATLQEGLALIRKPELAELGALSELKLRLSNQEQFLSDHLVEELHNHLYLKSPYCEGRWKALSSLSSSVGLGDMGGDDRVVFTWLEGYDGRVGMVEDPTRNPEADSFYYIQILVESLNRMGRLDSAVDEIERRLPVELFKVVERSHGEVEVRHPDAGRRVGSTKRQKQVHNSAAGKGGVGVEHEVVLRDLLGTLYAKFEAIGEGHRVLFEVTGAILKREGAVGYGESGGLVNRSFRELWKLLQSEIRSLLHDHLTLTGAAGGMGGGKGGREDVNAGMFRMVAGQRNRGKKMFKVSASGGDGMGTMDKSVSSPGGVDVLATEQEDLLNMLKDSVPGLVNTSHAALAHGGREQQEMVMADKSATGHKLLVEPSLFNMSILLPPSLGFLHRLRDLVPPASSSGVVASTSTGFLDDFLINVFYPQLDETLTELCAGGSEDFQVHPHWQKFSAKPIFKGAVRFFEVVEMVCGMLVALPHEQSFSRLVVREMRGWYERCFQWSKGLLSRAVVGGDGVQTGIRLAAELATSGSVNEVVIELMKDGDEREGLVLAEKESALLVKIVGERGGLGDGDLISDRKALGGLCTLLVSMRWLANKCGGLRFVSERAVDMGSGEEKRVSVGEKREKIHNHHVRRWTSAEAQLGGGLEGEPSGVYLPLDARTAEEFDGVLSMFTELSTLVLRTLHVDLRLHLLHGVAQALGHSYELGQAYNDPDPSILELSTALGTYDGVIEGDLLGAQYKFLTRGLGVLGNNALTSAPMLGSVGSMDEYGLARMQLNVLVLQQAIKNLDAEGSLSRSVEFLALGEGGCEGIVTKGKSGGFDREDLKVLVRLCWREERDGIDGDADWWVAKVMQEEVGGKSFPKRAASLRRGK
ncbi:exocyst subunit [Elasticomyces elasticus]|nr:exocyst subunit [Elasticomyces elasticus]